jgi:hypothetical protein
MIKVGDKVFCIKDFFYFDKKLFHNNKSYIVGGVSSLTKMIYIKDGISDNICSGFWFDINKDQYFITLAEFREQQIKSVIDE